MWKQLRRCTIVLGLVAITNGFALELRAETSPHDVPCQGVAHIPDPILAYTFDVAGHEVPFSKFFCKFDQNGVEFVYKEPFDWFGLKDSEQIVEAFVINRIDGNRILYFRIKFLDEYGSVKIKSIQKLKFKETDNLDILDDIYREAF